MRSGQPYQRAIGALVAVAFALAAAACGSTSVTETSAPDNVRCQTSLSATPSSVGPDGGTVSIGVSTTRDCAWTTSADTWIHLSTRSGQGEATFTASVDANPQIVARTGNVSVNGQRVVIAEDGRPCTFDLGSTNAHIPSSGGAGRIDVSTPDGCTWRAVSNASWIQVPGDQHTGAGSVVFQVPPSDGNPRDGSVTVAGRQFLVSQDAAPAPAPGPAPTPTPSPDCVASLQPATLDVGNAASTQSLTLTIGATCNWSVSTTAGWLSIVSPLTGHGSATIAVAVAANGGTARSGAITAAGQQSTIRQAAAPAPPPTPTCSYTLNPSSASMGSTGGSGRFTVSTQSGCTWSASTTTSWITLTNSAGTGTADVTFTAQANSATSARTGSIIAGGQTFTFTEAASAPACSYSISPASQNVDASGGAGSFAMNTGAGCTWTATSGAAWVTITAGSSGSGSGTVSFSVDANSASTPRAASVTAGGQTFTVNQAAVACSYAISPASLNVGASGGQGQFTITTQTGCAWSAAAGVSWITVTSGSGTGSGTVAYTVQGNTDTAARSGTVTAGGQTHTVTQDGAPCTYAINPTSGTAPASGAAGQFQVTTQSGCAWSATTGATWVTITSGSGSGTGTVAYTAQANSDTTPRSATITVGGQTYTLAQDAASGSTTTSP